MSSKVKFSKFKSFKVSRKDQGQDESKREMKIIKIPVNWSKLGTEITFHIKKMSPTFLITMKKIKVII